MTLTIDRCPECDEAIVACDNAIWLNYPAVAWSEYDAQWTIMQMGNMQMASSGDPSPDGKGHTLHVHQPPESVMR